MSLARRSLYRLSVQSRSISGYKVDTENIQRKKLTENDTEDEKFQANVDLAVLRRARTKLRGFEKVTYSDIRDRSEGQDPNESLRDKEDAVKYRSFQRYFDAAERERKRQRETGVWWKTLDYWLAQRDSRLSFVDIGLDAKGLDIKEYTSKKQQLKIMRNSDLERRARQRTLIVDVDSVMEEWERSSVGMQHIKEIVHHYDIFEDLFVNKDFYPVIPMNVGYQREQELIEPVYYGNDLLPADVRDQPLVYFEPMENKLYTLLLTNPDEHLEDNEREYIHWLVGNIPGNDISQGEVLVEYMPPFPSRGTGYQRMVFVLFQHDTKIDFSSEKRPAPCTSLRSRDFKTLEFYETFSHCLTPTSIRFYQCKWDSSVQNFFHNVLNMPEPVYEYAKLSEDPRYSKLDRHKEGKTTQWLSRFMPKEPIYPDGSDEFKNIQAESAIRASAAKERPDRKYYPVENVY